MRSFGLIMIGLTAGVVLAFQAVLNSALGKKTGSLGAVMVLSIITLVTLLLIIPLLPGTANFKSLPGPHEWYLYLGGVLGVMIVAAPIFLIPRIGATSTLTSIVIGQLFMALIFDQFGFFGSPRIAVSLPRVMGVALLVLSAYLITKK